MSLPDHPAPAPAAPRADAPAHEAGASPATPPRPRTWIPIRSLGPRHRDRIAAHLLSLNESDRYLRFGYLATDAQISKYVDTLDFEQDEVFGIFNRKLELIAMAHLAHSLARRPAGHPAMSEFGVSVLPHARGRRLGARLFEHATLHARNRGMQTLFIHALSENAAMLKIARNAGATVERAGSESEAWLRLPPDTLASHVGEMVGQRAAELDYGLKRGARQVSGLLDLVSEVKTSVGNSSRVAQD